jgi:hypothetical protein
LILNHAWWWTDFSSHARRLWASESEARELGHNLEIAKENLKILKRGYNEKLSEAAAEKQRLILERDARIESLEIELQEKEGLVQALQEAVTGQVWREK